MQRAYVYLHINNEFIPAGVMETNEEKRSGYSTFQYGKKYLDRADATAIDPITLPLSEILYNTPDYLVLFGAIRDAAPDSWGRYLLDKEAGKTLSEFDYLVAGGLDRIGALGFGPDPVHGPTRMGTSSKIQSNLNLDELVIAAQFYINNDEKISDYFLPFVEQGSSFGGARPKALVNYKDKSWVAKFIAKDDRRAETRIEYANMLLAKKCGISIPNLEHVTVTSGHDVLLIERFDRENNNGKINRKHFVSGLTMLNEHESYVVQIDPEKHSYGSLADIIRRYGSPGSIKEDMKELFRRMIFNIICSNSDDHLKNHGFLYDFQTSGWRLSPCYDIVPDVKPYNLLGLGVGPEGRQATMENAQEGAQQFGLGADEAKTIIENMCNISKNWKKHFAGCKVPDQDIQKLEKNFLKNSKKSPFTKIM
ncbi:MAG: type II toxin-antitoxin system HipA family toxin [Desulfobacula sp.]|uniref:type II toxin-antitoxin system HipA family toxin n=1 Tax=Desulfobacula sp. TaxID=2593537 RepID=UPI0025B81014|nr:HipA domain-containing protein [Desulfobacula sp.]MCD4719478.1 type II toxin-antitoxin system HipA family toxin [Desulfobacula sp.]